jgi:hypothetical protein
MSKYLGEPLVTHSCNGVEPLQDFLQRASTFSQIYKFTTEVSNEHDFLDRVSHIKDNLIIADLYSNPTDKQQYLLTSNCQPQHCCKSIPFSLALRIKRICSDPETFYIRSKELSKGSEVWIKRNKEEDIENAVSDADNKHRKELLEYILTLVVLHKIKLFLSLHTTLTYQTQDPSLIMINIGQLLSRRRN